MFLVTIVTLRLKYDVYLGYLTKSRPSSVKYSIYNKRFLWPNILYNSRNTLTLLNRKIFPL